MSGTDGTGESHAGLGASRAGNGGGTDLLSRTFAALADPTRRAILERLAGGEATVTELARPFRMSMPAVSKHLRVLQRAGLIVRGRNAQWRPCRLDARRLGEATRWLEDYRTFWEGSFDRLDAHLREIQAGTTAINPDDEEKRT